jgi:hypothetical protein
MLASAGSVGKAACEDREIPPGPPFARGGLDHSSGHLTGSLLV